jgi:hypothetical protein
MERAELDDFCQLLSITLQEEKSSSYLCYDISDTVWEKCHEGGGDGASVSELGESVVRI